MDSPDTIITRSVVSRRTVVQTGVRLAYTAPLISASYSLASLQAAARDNSQVSEDEAAKLVEAVNTPPIAVPGQGFEVEDTDGDGVEWVTVDGTSSADPDGKIVAYTWSFREDVVSREAVATVGLPVGTHRLVLTVTDDKGESASARIRIQVIEGPAQAQPTEEAAPDPEPTTTNLPPPPYEVEATQKNAEIAITWKVEPEVQPPYRVYRTIDDGLEHTEEEIDKFDWLLIREEWEKLSYRDAAIEFGVPYLYTVRTFDGINESERSNIVAITAQPIAEEPTVAPPADTPTPEPEVVVENTPTPTVEVVADTPTPEVVVEEPTEAPPPPPEEESKGDGAKEG